MKTNSKVLENVLNDKTIVKRFNSYYTAEDFINDAKAYAKAIKENRMICIIETVSKSGMSRTMKFLSCEKSKNNKHVPFYHRSYLGFFEALGYTFKNDTFRVNGCGMDMVFHTNYTTIHKLGRLGILTKKQVEELSQKTPTKL